MFLYGMKVDELNGPVPEEKKKSIIQYFKDHGYITGHSTNLCESNIFEMSENVNKFVVNNAADHESIGFACDPHYFNPENSFGPF